MRRNQSVEILRIVAAFGIVWFHADINGGDIAYFGLVVFLILSSYFRVAADRGDKDNISDLFTRLLLPWFSWFILYAIANYFRGRAIFPEGYSYLSDLLAGPSIHLWYLPFAFMALAVIDFCKRRCSSLVLLYIASFGACLCLLAAPAWVRWRLSPPSLQYINALMPVFAGVLLGLQRKHQAALNVYLVLILACMILCLTSLEFLALPYLIGLLLCLFAVNMGNVFGLEKANITAVSGCMFGVYVSHPLFFSAAKLLSIDPGIFEVIFAFMTSLIFTFLILNFAPQPIRTMLLGARATQVRLPTGAPALRQFRVN